jgi:hypothetical protein
MHPDPHVQAVCTSAAPLGDVPLDAAHVCLISNSVVAQRRLEPTVVTG